MSPDQFIEQAIRDGARDGAEALDPDRRMVFLISEAEVVCDMQGVESLLDAYAPDRMPDFAAAFEAVGAAEIAEALRKAATNGTDAAAAERLGTLITSRTGYDYDAIRRAVEARLHHRADSRESSEPPGAGLLTAIPNIP